jgi:hypothetical protein
MCEENAATVVIPPFDEATVRGVLRQSGHESNADDSKEIANNAKKIENEGRTTMNTSQIECPRGRSPLTVLIGVAATALAVVFDAAEDEPLHVTVESDEDVTEDETHRTRDDEVGGR